MRTLIVALILTITGLTTAYAGECFHSKQEIQTAHPGKYYRWDHHQKGHRGELCYYNTYAKASNYVERKVVPSVRSEGSIKHIEIRPVSATPAAQLLPLAWPEARVITAPWVDKFNWMVGMEPTERVNQVFAQLGVK